MSDQLKTRVSPQASDEITLRDILDSIRNLLAYWPWLVLSASFGLMVAFVFNRYTADTYRVTATVAVEETENPLASSIDGMLNLGFGFGGKGILDTRIAVLKSFAHNVRVARKLNDGLILFNKGRLNKREVYKPEHFSVEFDPLHQQLLGAEFALSFQDQGYELEISQEADKLTAYNFQDGQEVNVENLKEFTPGFSQHKYGEWVEHSLYRFRVLKGPNS